MDVGLNLGVVVASHRNLHSGGILLDDLNGRLHLLQTALVHGDECLVKPSLLLQVSRESTEHSTPELSIGILAGSTVDILVRVGCLVIVAEREFPWNH